MRRFAAVPTLLLLICVPCLHAQFTLQDSTTTADLRGIASVGDGVAWASGTHGTVLRTEDGGFVWQGCAMPPNAEQLDFRGVQAFDAQTALVMSSGKGDLSRVYKTMDGCRTWTLVFTNPDVDGFLDAIQAVSVTRTTVLGDPVHGSFPVFELPDSVAGDVHRREISATGAEAAFAASNASLLLANASAVCLVTGGSRVEFICQPATGDAPLRSAIPMEASQSSGAFALQRNPSSSNLVAVGGDFRKPDASARVAAWSSNGQVWLSAQTAPHGYRSSVAYDATSKTWITVGPNGTDISSDDGHNWSPLRPAKDDQPDADKHWNALSLPFVVGPGGRIGRLRDSVLTTPTDHKAPTPAH